MNMATAQKQHRHRRSDVALKEIRCEHGYLCPIGHEAIPAPIDWDVNPTFLCETCGLVYDWRVIIIRRESTNLMLVKPSHVEEVTNQ